MHEHNHVPFFRKSRTFLTKTSSYSERCFKKKVRRLVWRGIKIAKQLMYKCTIVLENYALYAPAVFLFNIQDQKNNAALCRRPLNASKSRINTTRTGWWECIPLLPLTILLPAGQIKGMIQHVQRHTNHYYTL
jgi:hypothetical protein